MAKQKSLRKILDWIIIYCQNIAGGNALYFPLHGPNHLQLKFLTKMQNFKRVLDLNRWINLIFSICFQILKI